ncbi:MAG: NUDIX domain-containing protein [candidate division Zixibacteria bacterium]|nr:NUDIX hydrolase [candidate division Zixibacteria bacterium]NIW42082.1 NUDIX domain-containing protein [candidate division Zixibacteria bacterium]NIX56821.1 NUDIX domain-containing protein [candidate division Zixibacteria bacterium]
MAVYKHCPMCATEMKNFNDNGQKRRYCPNCGFVHYKNPAPAAGCVVFKDGKLLWVERAHEPKVGYWTIPAGFCEWEENPAETAVRELKEETNLDVEITGVFKIYNGNDDPRTNAILILYFADVVGGELKASDDASRAEFLGLHESPEKIAFKSHKQALHDLKTNYPEKFKTDAN